MSKIVIGTMARFVAKKNISMLVEAVRILKAKDVNIECVIGGGGELEEKIKEQIKDYGLGGDIKMLGWVKNKEKFYKEIDIYALPSLDEPFGIVILEAFKYGVPVVSTGAFGPKDIISDKKTGLISDFSPMDFAKKIEMLVGDKSLRDKISKDALRELNDKYSVKVAGVRLEEVLVEVLG